MLNLTSELAQWAEVALRAIGATGVVTMTVFMVKLYHKWVLMELTVRDGFASVQLSINKLERDVRKLEDMNDIENAD